MPRALSLHHLSNLDIAAPELIRAAHGAGFSHVCLFTMGWPSPDFTFPVVDDGQLLKDTRAALADTGIKVFNADAPMLWPTSAAGPMSSRSSSSGWRTSEARS